MQQTSRQDRNIYILTWSGISSGIKAKSESLLRGSQPHYTWKDTFFVLSMNILSRLKTYARCSLSNERWCCCTSRIQKFKDRWQANSDIYLKYSLLTLQIPVWMKIVSFLEDPDYLSTIAQEDSSSTNLAQLYIWGKLQNLLSKCFLGHWEMIQVLLGWFLIEVDMKWLFTLGGEVMLVLMWHTGGMEEYRGSVGNKLTLMFSSASKCSQIWLQFTSTKIFTCALLLSNDCCPILSLWLIVSVCLSS